MKLRILYEPKSRAREYGELALNLYRGCSHGCTYCYVPAVVRMSRDEFNTPEPTLRPGVLDKLRHDVKVLADAGDKREIFLSFTSDPYHGGDTSPTREALRIIGEAGFKATILTKGGLRAERDFDLMAKHGFSFGTTLTTLHDVQAKEWEPCAPFSFERVEAIRKANARFIRTWVSLEPVLDPARAIEIVQQLHPFVRHWKVGKLNHDKAREAEIDWEEFMVDITVELETVGADYYIKQDLRDAAGWLE